jgi:hypothetical protein
MYSGNIPANNTPSIQLLSFSTMSGIATHTQNTAKQSAREIIKAKDIMLLVGCSERSAYRIMQQAKKKAGRMNGPLTVDQFSMYSGISRNRIKEAIR